MSFAISAPLCAPDSSSAPASKRVDFQILLTRYALERFLYRLSISDQCERFVLKGAMLFAIWQDDPFRPTRDLDLLGHGNPDPATVAASIRSICSVEVPDDGVVFDVAGIEAAPIRDEDEYPGVRVRTGATIAGARLPIQIDVGFGDVITPEAIEIEYPALLDPPAPILRAYPPDTVVAEKAEVSLGIANSRMKDFYDLWMIAQTFTLEGDNLANAIQQTFERRRTPLPEQVPVGLSDSFALEKDKPSGGPSWPATSSRVASASLVQVINDLRTFLQPVLARTEVASWPPGGPWTEVECR